jgi:GYF domain 2
MNNWPKWLPYPISWIRAFVLNSVLVSLFWSHIPFRRGSSVIVALVGAWVAVPFLFAFFHWAIASIVTFVLARLPTHPKLDLLRRYLSDRLPDLRRAHWREGLNAFIVTFVAFVVAACVVSVIPVPSKQVAYEYDLYLLRRSMLRLSIDLMPTAMVVIAAYLYQYDLWARRRRAVKVKSAVKAQEPAKKRSPNSNSPAPDPIEQDLNQLKVESGMNRVKAVRRSVPPIPELAEWYVFRSGQAEGPYTKMQLLEVQKISDRTKVRRGESEWQRASEIPELVAYLTEKS